MTFMIYYIKSETVIVQSMTEDEDYNDFFKQHFEEIISSYKNIATEKVTEIELNFQTTMRTSTLTSTTTMKPSIRSNTKSSQIPTTISEINLNKSLSNLKQEQTDKNFFDETVNEMDAEINRLEADEKLNIDFETFWDEHDMEEGSNYNLPKLIYKKRENKPEFNNIETIINETDWQILKELENAEAIENDTQTMTNVSNFDFKVFWNKYFDLSQLSSFKLSTLNKNSSFAGEENQLSNLLDEKNNTLEDENLFDEYFLEGWKKKFETGNISKITETIQKPLKIYQSYFEPIIIPQHMSEWFNNQKEFETDSGIENFKDEIFNFDKSSDFDVDYENFWDYYNLDSFKKTPTGTGINEDKIYQKPIFKNILFPSEVIEWFKSEAIDFELIEKSLNEKYPVKAESNVNKFLGNVNFTGDLQKLLRAEGGLIFFDEQGNIENKTNNISQIGFQQHANNDDIYGEIIIFLDSS